MRAIRFGILAALLCALVLATGCAARSGLGGTWVSADNAHTIVFGEDGWASGPGGEQKYEVVNASTLKVTSKDNAVRLAKMELTGDVLRLEGATFYRDGSAQAAQARADEEARARAAATPPEPAAPAPPEPAAPVATPFVLRIAARAGMSSRVSVLADGGPVTVRTLEDGAVLEWRITDSADIVIGTPSSVVVTRDGKAVALPAGNDAALTLSASD